jgi:hypothetical protein
MSNKKYLAVIQGDCGHLDYVYRVSEVDEEEKDKIIKALDLIDDFEEKFHNNEFHSGGYIYPDHNIEHLAEYLNASWDNTDDTDEIEYIKADVSEEQLENPEFRYVYSLPIEDIMLLVWFFDFYMPEGREDCDTDYNSGCHTLSHYKIYEISDIVRDSVGSF